MKINYSRLFLPAVNFYRIIMNFNKTIPELELNHYLQEYFNPLKKKNSSSSTIFSLSCLVLSSWGHIGDAIIHNHRLCKIRARGFRV